MRPEHQLTDRFAVVLIPVFEDPEEQTVSPYRNEDWYDERMSWKWMNTVMRVNSLVQKVCSAVQSNEEHLAEHSDGHHCICHCTISFIFPIFRSRR